MEDRGPQVVVIFTTFLALTWISVSLRCYVRLRIVRLFALDDWLAVATLVLYTLFCGFGLDSVGHGGGRHHADLSRDQIREGLKDWYFSEIFYVLNSSFLRLALAAFLLRVAVKKVHRKFIYTLMTIQIVFNVSYLFISIFTCFPPSFFWNHLMGAKGTCIDAGINKGMTYAQASIAAATDWAFALLPVAMLWDLQMRRKKKIAVGVLMGIGAIASTAAIIRIPYIASVDQPLDFLYATTDLAIWSAVEPGLGLSAVCLAACRPLLDRFKGFGGDGYPTRRGRGRSDGREEEWGRSDFWMQDGEERGEWTGSAVAMVRRAEVQGVKK
ncbi:hypothetical protein P152DRAFT_391370 [Eremomyces bilateralis CBS 781.70]|uniref:Rhodopsin domain-containing protein n=1 Tax=Eremomyces bilateralis CBS 781.70 TaxID=1392243 RepID=A0A6G1G9Z4_9PEZI|nr:uncharacterized protein P152DRAFT_391370 [Eremomyces bilateralis CBS 781.70]KAF1814766.1 hypothetical protein P152DRAFT_391370 [Eremomyces bilateralis CBS 781.70]